MSLSITGLHTAADRLIAAAAAPQQCDPVRDILGGTDIASACAVQHLLTEDSLRRGRRIVGHKIGLTSLAAQHQLGVEQPGKLGGRRALPVPREQDFARKVDEGLLRCGLIGSEIERNHAAASLLRPQWPLS
jgi:hypothetical protein